MMYKYKHDVQAYQVTGVYPADGYISIARPLDPKLQMPRTGFAVHQPQVGGYWIVPAVGEPRFLDKESFERDYTRV